MLRASNDYHFYLWYPNWFERDFEFSYGTIGVAFNSDRAILRTWRMQGL